MLCIMYRRGVPDGAAGRAEDVQRAAGGAGGPRQCYCY